MTGTGVGAGVGFRGGVLGPLAWNEFERLVLGDARGGGEDGTELVPSWLVLRGLSA